MPELPEVEHVRKQLESLLGVPRERHLVGAELYRRDLRFPFSKKFRDNLRLGKGLGPLLGIERRAKYLLFRFASGYLLSHLGMTGSWREVRGKFAPGEFEAIKGRHDHVRLVFDSDQSLVFEDPRRFGYMDWVENIEEHKLLRNLGPEPLLSDFNSEYLFQATRGRSTTIKAFIMDARQVVGVGNIYASEALYRAKIRPLRKAGKLKPEETTAIVASIQTVLKAAIASGGSSIRTFKGADGYRGGFQDLHLVYGRAGEPCAECGSKIVSKVIAGRSTFWCPNCQPR